MDAGPHFAFEPAERERRAVGSEGFPDGAPPSPFLCEACVAPCASVAQLPDEVAGGADILERKRISPGAALRPQAPLHVGDRLHAMHAVLLEERERKVEARRAAAAQEEDMLRLARRAAPPGLVEEAAMRLYSEALERRARQEQRLAERAAEERLACSTPVESPTHRGAFDAVLAAGDAVPRWQSLHDRGMELKRSKYDRSRMVAEDEAAQAARAALTSRAPVAHPDGPVHSRLWEDAVRRREQQAMVEEMARAEEEQSLREVSVHHGKAADIRGLVDRLHAAPPRKGPDESATPRPPRTAGGSARFQLLYRDAGRRLEERRRRAEEARDLEEKSVRRAAGAAPGGPGAAPGGPGAPRTRAQGARRPGLSGAAERRVQQVWRRLAADPCGCTQGEAHDFLEAAFPQLARSAVYAQAVRAPRASASARLTADYFLGLWRGAAMVGIAEGEILSAIGLLDGDA